MEYSRDSIISEFLKTGKQECGRVNLQYFNCVEAKSLIADYLYPEVKQTGIISDENLNNIAETCDIEYNYSECNKFNK